VNVKIYTICDLSKHLRRGLYGLIPEPAQGAGTCASV
jgi:hypothetical protein